MISKIIAIIKITRPVNFLITFISIVIAGFIANGNEILSLQLLSIACSGALAISAGNVINDYFDYEIDKINRPERVLSIGIITRKQSLIIYFVILFLSLMLAVFVSFKAFIFLLLFSPVIFLYSAWFKKIPLFGNFIVAAVLGFIGFIYPGFVLANTIKVIIPACFAFLINFIRELLKDMEDIEGDMKCGVITFPLKYGFRLSKSIIIILTSTLIILTFIPFVFVIYKIEFFVIVMIIVNPLLIYFLKELYHDDSKKNLGKLSKLIKLNMIFGLLAIFIGR